MAESVEQSGRRDRRRWLLGGLLAVLSLLFFGYLAWGVWFQPRRIGPAQPIAFSHRFHATEKKISCMFCHPDAAVAARAGVPPLETCMLCHSRIIIHHPQIEILRDHYNRGQPVRWVKVNQVPDFTYFNHQRHVRLGYDCGRCHGDVAGMDRVAVVNEFTMGFCVQCHRDEGYSVDCYVCHR